MDFLPLLPFILFCLPTGINLIFCIYWPIDLYSFLKYFIYIFLERGEGREKERERNINWLPYTHPQLGTWPETQGCVLGKWDLSVCRSVLNPLSHISQDILFLLIISSFVFHLYLNSKGKNGLEIKTYDEKFVGR